MTDYEEDQDSIAEVAKGRRFTEKDLDSLSVSEQGVAFHVDFGRSGRAWEPASAYRFSFEQLKPYIRKDGLLGSRASSLP